MQWIMCVVRVFTLMLGITDICNVWTDFSQKAKGLKSEVNTSVNIDKKKIREKKKNSNICCRMFLIIPSNLVHHVRLGKNCSYPTLRSQSLQRWSSSHWQ